MVKKDDDTDIDLDPDRVNNDGYDNPRPDRGNYPEYTMSIYNFIDNTLIY